VPDLFVIVDYEDAPAGGLFQCTHAVKDVGDASLCLAPGPDIRIVR
jgi:hypothetical protein